MTPEFKYTVRNERSWNSQSNLFELQSIIFNFITSLEGNTLGVNCKLTYIS